jgi:hypothetical protein
MARRRSPGDFRGGIDIDPFGMDSGSTPADDRNPTGGYHDKGENDGLPTDNSHGSQTPRERVPPPHMPPPPAGGPGGPSPMGQGNASGGVATPQMPMYPSPQAGSTSMATGGSTDQSGSTAAAFHPLPSPAMGMMTSARRSLYGKAGGLLGGGLGAQDTTSNNVSDPISSLIQILQKRQGGF